MDLLPMIVQDQQVGQHFYPHLQDQPYFYLLQIQDFL